MTTADFYVGLGDQAEWLGSLSLDGSQASVDDAGLFDPLPSEATYTETTFRTIVAHLLAHAIEADAGYSAKAGDVWPWPYPDSGGTDMAYVYVNGSIHIFERGDRQELDKVEAGQTLITLHYPNGSRKISYFKRMDA